MAELILPRDERLALKARAHHLNVVVLLGAAGQTEPAVKEIDRALAAHELVKIRVPGDDRDAREAIFADLAERLGAARVQMIGKLLVLYRPRPDEPPLDDAPRERRAARPAAARKPAAKAGAPAKRKATPRGTARRS